MPTTMPDSAQTTGPSGDQQPEQKSVLGFPVRPEGDGGAVAGGRHHWYELAQEVHGAFADIDRAIASMQWSGDGRRAFDAAWSQLSGHGTEAAQHSQEMGDHLLKLGHQIDDAQNQWDMAMAAMVASTAIGIGLTFVTFGISDAVAEGAAAAAVGTMEAVCAALDISLEAAVQVMIAAIRIGVQLAVKFTWQFGINVVSQEAANVVQGQGLDHVNLLQAAEFAAAATLIPGLGGKVTIGGKQVLQGASGAFVSGALTDTAIQGMEAVTEGKPFSPGEVVASGILAMGGHAVAGAIGSRLGAAQDGEVASSLRKLCPDAAQLERLQLAVENPSTLEKYLGRMNPDALERSIAETSSRGVPQGMTGEQFTQLSEKVRTAAGRYGNDIRIQGSRAAGAAVPGTSDMDIAIRVSPQRFEEIIRDQFGTPNPGSSREATMLHAIESGKIQRGELRLSSLGRQLSVDTAIEKVDISVIEVGGTFDKGPWIPLR
jgi:hypothetical protein